MSGRPCHDFCPRFAEVAGFENVGLEIVELVGVDGDVSGGGVERRRFDEADHRPFGDIFWRDFVPTLAAIARHVDQAVIGAGPEYAFLLRRFR